MCRMMFLSISGSHRSGKDVDIMNQSGDMLRLRVADFPVLHIIHHSIDSFFFRDPMPLRDAFPRMNWRKSLLQGCSQATL